MDLGETATASRRIDHDGTAGVLQSSTSAPVGERSDRSTANVPSERLFRLTIVTPDREGQLA